MSGSWNAGDRHTARVNACKGHFSPRKYTVRVDDTHAQWRYRIATTALWGQSTRVEEFFRLSAEYVIRNHRRLAEVRREIREEEKKLRKQKKERERAERAAYRANPGMWNGRPPAMPKRRKRKGGRKP